MSIIAETSEGWIMCHRKLLYSTFQLKPELFYIRTPLTMDSAAQKIACDMSTETSSSEGPVRKKHGRKRKHSDKEEIQNMEENKMIQDIQELIKLGFDLKYFDDTPLTKEDWLQNNKTARSLSRKLDPLSFHLLKLSEDFSKSSELKHTVLCTGVSQDLQLTCLTLVQSECSEPVIVSLQGQQYIIPERSSFILGDVLQALKNICKTNKKYDLILMDPPWLNKSVKRMKRYGMMEMECLRNLPIAEIAEQDCLIAVWTTNNSDQIAFVKEVLFPLWSVTYLTMWKWIKVTQKGLPITAFGSFHKKPYENLLLGRFKAFPFSETDTDLPVMEKVFVSIPSMVHSHKPPVYEILKSLVKTREPSCLELFARYLLAHWTSCGNEVLKLQHVNYYNGNMK